MSLMQCRKKKTNFLTCSYDSTAMSYCNMAKIKQTQALSHGALQHTHTHKNVKNSTHEYFIWCARTSSEHLNVWESINSLSVSTPKPHSLLPPSISLCPSLPLLNGHIQGHPFKGPHHPATVVPWGAYTRHADWDWSGRYETKLVGLLPSSSLMARLHRASFDTTLLCKRFDDEGLFEQK